MEAIKLLIVEDNTVDALCLREALEESSGKGFAISHAETLSEAKERLDKEDFQVVVLDLGLPDCQGMETLLEVKSSHPDIPIVVLSGLGDERLAIEAVRRGAQDYLVKDHWDGRALSRAISYAIERQRFLTGILRFKTPGESKDELVNQVAGLRSFAQRSSTEAFHSEASPIAPSTVDLSRHEMVQLIYELQVNQIELEMQNEELQRAECELEKSRRDYADLYEFAPVGYFTLDEHGVILRANLTGSQILSKDRNRLLDKPFSALLSQDDADTLHLHLGEVFSTGSNQSCEMRLLNGGSISYIRLESVSIKGPQGHDGRCRTILTDITDRKLAEERIRESDRRFRTIFEAAVDHIFLKDRSLRYTAVNPAFEKLTGISASEILGKRHEDLFGPEMSDHIRNVDLRVLQGETVEDASGWTIRGIPMSFLGTRTPLRDASGEIVGILTILHDLTDRKKDAAFDLPAEGEYISQAMRTILKQVKIVAKGDSTILLTGESGSGKDHLARYIHNRSKRANGPYFSINCAAIPPELAESELFGHEKGAFSGAVNRKRGLFELAEGGTLLLNEIGELTLPLQAKLLTFLDTRSFLRVGGQKPVLVNARLMAATHRNLREEVQEKRFLEPLFYRLNVFPIEVPPLRERKEDIPILAREIMVKLAGEIQLKELPLMDSLALETLQNYAWPGNVRELRNVLERSLMLWTGGPFSVDLPGIRESSPGWSCVVKHSPKQHLQELLDEVAYSACEQALEACGGNKRESARKLGISRDTLYRYLKKMEKRRENQTLSRDVSR